MEFDASLGSSRRSYDERGHAPTDLSTSPQVRALIADSAGVQTTLALRTVATDELGDGDVLIAVSWSSVNFKDALATRKDGKVARINPLIPGIDLAGEIVDPGSSDLDVGAPVVVHGYDLGVAHHGGYSPYARVPADWIVPLPAGLSLRDAMTLGTAGFTAALSVITLLEHGLRPDQGPVVVTGATGGVGSVAVSILAAQGFAVTAVTGKADATDWLHALGASVVADRSGVGDPARPLQKETWAGAVDSVGGGTLAAVLASMRYGSAVAASGNTGGIVLPTTVFPLSCAVCRCWASIRCNALSFAAGKCGSVWPMTCGRRCSTSLPPMKSAWQRFRRRWHESTPAPTVAAHWFGSIEHLDDACRGLTGTGSSVVAFFAVRRTSCNTRPLLSSPTVSLSHADSRVHGLQMRPSRPRSDSRPARRPLRAAICAAQGPVQAAGRLVHPYCGTSG